MDKPNRAERRKHKFGGGRATEHGGWPTHQPNPVFGAETPRAEAAFDESIAGPPDQDQTAESGPGSGATEQSNRAPRRPSNGAQG